MIKKLNNFIHENNQRLFWGLCIFSGILALSYAYFVNVSVLSVISRQNAEEKISTLEARVAGIEFSYLEALEKVTREEARKLGFREPAKVVFASKKNLSRSLVILDSRF